MAEARDPYQVFLETFVPWAERRSDIRGAVVVGSRARVMPPPDELSDIDLMLITTRPKFYYGTAGWLNELGDLTLTYRQPPVVGQRNIRTAVFDGPVHVDFAIVSDMETRWGGLLLRVLSRAPRFMRLLPSSLENQIDAWFAILRKGTPVALVDKGGAGTRMHVRPPAARPHPPTQEEFDETAAAFWSHCLWTSKLLLRHELWMAVFVSDHLAKTFALRMIEWSAAGRTGQGDVWYNGRFLERWGGEKILHHLPRVFPRYDQVEAWKALNATMDMFSAIAREAAERLGLRYEDGPEVKTRWWIAAREASVRQPAREPD